MREGLGLEELENEIPLSVIKKMGEPVLLTKATSVSGKLYLAGELQQYDKIGQDAVAVVVNDLLAEGARPLLFHDMIESARPKPDRLRELETGVRIKCKEADVRFVGSEIMELPEIIAYDQYAMMGFATGVKDRAREDTALPFADGDVILGLPSDGLHNNGYVLARKKLFLSRASMEVYYETLGTSLGDLLMQPTKMYKGVLEQVYESGLAVKSVCQVKHGGLDAGIRTLLKNQAGAVVKQRAEQMQPLYQMLHSDGNIPMEQMRQNFNMGIGMLLLVSEEDADALVDEVEKAGEQAIPLGLVEKDSFTIRYV